MKKFEELYELVKQDIIDGKYQIGDELPSEHYFKDKYQVSRSTIRQMLDTLLKNEFISKSQGKKSIIINNTEKRATVLLIIHDVYTYIYQEIISSIEHIMRENNINTVISFSYRSKAIEQNNIRNLLPIADAVIIDPTETEILSEFDNIIYSELKKKPCVCINAEIKGFTFPSFIVNDRKVMKKLTCEMLEKNKTRFLLIMKKIDYQGNERYLGIKEAINDNPQITIDEVDIVHQTEQEITEMTFKRTLEYNPDVIMFHNDQYAYDFLKKYKEFVSDKNIIVTGFDNCEINNSFIGTIPSPSHPKSAMGEDAANAVIEMLKGKEVESKLYDVEIKNLV